MPTVGCRDDAIATRRQVLATGAAAIGAGVAGCVGDLSDGSSLGRVSGTDGSTETTGDAVSDDGGGPEIQASFYLLYDLTRRAAGPKTAVDSIVPFGQHGHGWDGPTAGQQREIFTSDLFVYVGDGFQPWADDVVERINDDGADVEVASARGGVNLLEYGADGDEDGNAAPDASDDHDQTAHDPHFWLDPRRAARAVENIRDGVIAVDPDREAAHRERAEEYRAELLDLHEDFEDALSDADRDAVLVAGHNAFGYLGRTYGFDVHGLTGLSPDEGISASTRRTAQAIIEEHDIEYVLHPALEPREPAEQLVADTDVTGVLDVTAISGVTDEWIEEDLGYVELMRTINLPSFRTALGAA